MRGTKEIEPKTPGEIQGEFLTRREGVLVERLEELKRRIAYLRGCPITEPSSCIFYRLYLYDRDETIRAILIIRSELEVLTH